MERDIVMQSFPTNAILTFLITCDPFKWGMRTPGKERGSGQLTLFFFHGNTLMVIIEF